MKISWQIFWKLYSLFKNHTDDGQGSSLLTVLLTKRLISVFLHFLKKATLFTRVVHMYIHVHTYIHTYMYICIHTYIHTSTSALGPSALAILQCPARASPQAPFVPSYALASPHSRRSSVFQKSVFKIIHFHGLISQTTPVHVCTRLHTCTCNTCTCMHTNW